MVVIMAMVIGRTIPVAWMDAECAIRAAHRAADRATDDTANWTSSVTTLRRAPLHAPDNSLSVNRDWRAKQSHNHGYSKFLPHRLFS
jgi:hypothetical protein